MSRMPGQKAARPRPLDGGNHRNPDAQGKPLANPPSIAGCNYGKLSGASGQRAGARTVNTPVKRTPLTPLQGRTRRSTTEASIKRSKRPRPAQPGYTFVGLSDAHGNFLHSHLVPFLATRSLAALGSSIQALRSLAGVWRLGARLHVNGDLRKRACRILVASMAAMTVQKRCRGWAPVQLEVISSIIKILSKNTHP